MRLKAFPQGVLDVVGLEAVGGKLALDAVAGAAGTVAFGTAALLRVLIPAGERSGRAPPLLLSVSLKENSFMRLKAYPVYLLYKTCFSLLFSMATVLSLVYYSEVVGLNALHGIVVSSLY